MAFDARRAKLLKPGEHLLIDDFPGLRLEASATRKTWTYRYKSPDGRMKQQAIGQWPAKGLQEAMADWRELRAKVADGIDIKAQRQVEKAPVAPVVVYTVQDVVDDFVARHLKSERAAPSALADERALRRLLSEIPAFAASPAALVDRGVAFDLLDARKATPTATGKLRSLLGGAWDLALDAGRLPGSTPNWWRVVLRGRLKSKGKIIGGEHVGKKRRTLQASEIGALMAWLPNMHTIGQDATQLYLWTAMRGVEIFAMQPEFISNEADGWWLTIPKSITKNERYADAVDHRVPLLGRALEIVQRRSKEASGSSWLFATMRDGKFKQYIQHSFSTYIYGLQPYSAKVARRAGDGLIIPVAGWTPHDLRRSARTMLAAMECPEEVAEAILGHMPAEIVAAYNAHRRVSSYLSPHLCSQRLLICRAQVGGHDRVALGVEGHRPGG